MGYEEAHHYSRHWLDNFVFLRNDLSLVLWRKLVLLQKVEGRTSRDATASAAECRRRVGKLAKGHDGGPLWVETIHDRACAFCCEL